MAGLILLLETSIENTTGEKEIVQSGFETANWSIYSAYLRCGDGTSHADPGAHLTSGISRSPIFVLLGAEGPYSVFCTEYGVLGVYANDSYGVSTKVIYAV